MYKKIKLPNGLRLILIPVDGSRSVTVSAYVKAGSRNESKQNNGIAHFLEHMAFKGTDKYPTFLDVSKLVEGVGGVMNASTSHEVIEYYLRAEPSNLAIIFDVLNELILRSKFDEAEIQKEKGIILEEIKMYDDMPQARVARLNSQILWPDHPLGWDIAGTRENVSSFSRQNFTDYYSKYFKASNMLIGVSGKFDEQKVVDLVSKYFSLVQDKKTEEPQLFIDSQKEPNFISEKKDLEQTNLVLSFRGYKRSDPKRYTLKILAMILGGGFSSRLFQHIRENLGLAYSIYAGSQSFSDAGCFVISAGVSNQTYSTAISEIVKELKVVVKDGVGETELNQHKNHYKGILALSLEDHEHLNSFVSEQELLTGEILSYEDIIANIEAVTTNDILNVAKEVFVESKLNLAVIGKIDPESARKAAAF